MTDAGAPLLRMRAVAKAFGARRAVAGVTFEVAAGEIVLVVGRNGAGKTTLLRIATGFIDADAGEVEIAGNAIGGSAGERGRARAQAQIGYLPEHAPAASELTVGEHLRARARTKRVAGAKLASEVTRVVAAAELESVMRQRIATLSKGFRQRVGLADALIASPPLLILDEPTSGMDPVQVRQLRDLIARAVDEGARAAVISSHAVADLEPIATRVIVMRGGAIVADQTPTALRGDGTLEAAVVALLGSDGGDEARAS